MPAPTVLPGRAFQQVDLRSRLLFHWRASDQTLKTVGGLSTGVFTRASAGGEVPETNGRLVGPAPDGLERWEYVDTNADGVRDASALRLEGARTNLVVQSENLSTAAGWTLTRVTTDLNSTIVAAPDGRFTADVVIPSTDDNTHLISQIVTASSGSDYSISAFFRARELDQLRFSAVAGPGSTAHGGVLADLAAGTVTNSTFGGGTVVSKSLTAYGDSWYRVKAVVDLNSTDSTVQYTAAILSTGGADNYASNGTDGIYAWGMQFEDSVAFETSYIPTAAAAVTRANEVLTFPYAAKPQAQTMYVKFVERGTIDGGIAASPMMIAASGSAVPRFMMYVTSAKYAIQHANGVGDVNSVLAAAPSIGDVVELRATLTSAGVAQICQSINGAAETSSTATAALALAPQWAALPFVHIDKSGAFYGFASYIAAKVVPGVRSMGFMRGAF